MWAVGRLSLRRLAGRRQLDGSSLAGGVGNPKIAQLRQISSAVDDKSDLKNSQKTSLVIFDKDGTLICFHAMWTPWALSTADRIATASGLDKEHIASEVYDLLGYCPVERKVKPGMLAEATMPQIREQLTKMLIKHGVDESRANEIIHLDTDDSPAGGHGETLQSLHNLKTLFRELRSHDIKVAICTADSRKGTMETLKALELDQLVDAVVCGDDINTHPKPHPHNAHMICSLLGIDPKETYMVGDTLADVKMGRSAQLAGSIGVLSGVATEEQLAPHADHIIDDVGDIMPIVRNKKTSSYGPADGEQQFSPSTGHRARPGGSPRRHNPAMSPILAKRSSTSIDCTSRRHVHTDGIPRAPGDPKPTHIIVGAGSAGCVLANRLSADPNNRVALLEAGPRDDWWRWKIHMPAALMYNLCNDNYNWYYHTLPQRYMNNRIMYWPRGRVWGGSSSLNAMCYVRGHAEDYDRWGREGAEGWSYANCLPYFKRSQTHNLGPSDYRGGEGPLTVTQGACENPLHHAWMVAGVEAGYGFTDDMNGYRQEGVGRMDMTIKNGKRCSAAQAYLWPTNILTSKILFDGKKAIGVQISRENRNINDYGEAREDSSMTAINSDKLYTEGEVILCGGSINSPQLLMLSGIGPGGHLKECEIEVLQDMPGVGQNLQDHLEIYIQQECTQPITLYDQSSWKFPHNMIRIGLQWFYNQTGLGASTHLESGGFVRSNVEQTHPNVQWHFLPSTVNDHGRSAGDRHAYQVHVGPMRPTSRGWLGLKSSDPRQHVVMQPNYLSTEFDRQEFRDCIRISRDVFAQPAFAPYRGAELFPGRDVQSDEQLDSFVRERADSAYHPSCTTKMGLSSDNMAVVDGKTMKVHGIEGLRVVDASVMPSVVSGNLNGPTIMLAERAADLILGKTPLPADKAPVWQIPKDKRTKTYTSN